MRAETVAGVGDIAVLYVDDTVVVLNKPPGLLSVPGRGPEKQDCLSSRVQSHYPDALVVHRLDMATSGLLVMARGAAAQRALNQSFASRVVHKRYVAVVMGALTSPAATWQVIDLPIIVDWPNRPLRVIDRLRGQASTTRWRSVQADAATDQTTRVELEPITGRSHQLRVHLQAIGHPIVGDALYAPVCATPIATRLLLHAQHLAFPHPRHGDTMVFECPPDF